MMHKAEDLAAEELEPPHGERLERLDRELLPDRAAEPLLCKFGGDREPPGRPQWPAVVPAVPRGDRLMERGVETGRGRVARSGSDRSPRAAVPGE